MPDVSNLTLSGARPGQGQTNEVGNFQMSLLGHFTPPATAAINLKRLAAFIAASLCRLIADILNVLDRGPPNRGCAAVT